MNLVKSLLKLIAVVWMIASLAGCAAASTSTPPPVSTQPAPGTPLLPSPTARQPTGEQEIFSFVQTVQVASDVEFLSGNFVRIGYVPATDRLVVAFMALLVQPDGGCTDYAHVYKEYTLDMQPTGRSGVLLCGGGDSGDIFVGDVLYDVAMTGTSGWGIQSFDATTFESLNGIFHAVDAPQEGTGDAMLAFVNGMLDVSGGYSEAGGPPSDEDSGSHHNFFTTDLELIEKRILSDVPHRSEGAMIFVDGVYYYVTSTSYTGDMFVMRYDERWNFLDSKVLVSQVHFPTGIAFDGQRFYVAYLDTSQRNGAAFFPCYPNVRLAAFDREWNLLDDVAVTDYEPPDYKANKPWIALHGNRLYVSYDVTPLDPATGEELLEQNQAFVSVYELAAP